MYAHLWRANAGGVCSHGELAHLLAAARREAAQAAATRPRFCCHGFVAASRYAAVPPPECSRFGLCSWTGHEQLSGQPAANFRWCEGRAGNISGIHCREMLKLYLGLWQRRDVTAERRWMEPLQSSALFCSESSASAAEELPERTWWGKNFHVILGRAQDSLVVTVLWLECARRETNDSNLSSLSSLWHKGKKCRKVLRDAWSPK